MRDTFHQRADEVTYDREPAYEGQSLHGARYEDDDGINATPAVAHKITLTVNISAGSEDIGFTITQGDASYDFEMTTESGDDTDAKATTRLLAALQAAGPGSVLDIADVQAGGSSTTITLTAYSAGSEHAFTLSGLTANLSQATTATGADATEIVFGRAVIATLFSRTSAFATKQAEKDSAAQNFVALPSSSTIGQTQSSFVFGGTYTADEVVRVTVNYREGGINGSVSVDASHGSTLDGMGADAATKLTSALTAAGSPATVAYDSGSNTLTVTAKRGTAITATAFVNAASTSLTITAEGSVAASLDTLFLGVSTRRADEDTDTVGTYANRYRANSGVVFQTRGRIWVKCADAAGAAPIIGSTVYIGTASGEEGKFYKAGTSSRLAIDPALARWRGGRTSGMALLAIGPR